ncbi:hypothetical protein LTR10_014240 [Elasticomyces elasticus]|uniref:Uncharacterized protein n=1 Tax=Exophiala sideris TaxID=1016849 RepID=A0ABR0JIP7_9EURO|nr:hypothetical protein LTR10_014240 [Elasticomyces elasticus]KAK5034280.1 hypothetical protein LTS07_003200 [Exophiala sideris]KAK5042577.1 hypothetical protein LTR13_001424 [Exophiala sideris]KAK5065659.1 hypothetical protein LTR69_003208 [Exophiala sideris]KAK5185883.1 hypothetical protein LTR44_001932 [Eurotiomycetes sp. CCFEE 6388]
MDNNPNSLPCPSQIAIALLIVKSKPTQSSIEEHLDSLRKAVIPKSDAGSSPTFDFDPAVYWEGQYRILESQKTKLLDDIAALKEGVRADRDTRVPEPSAPSSALGKRKRTNVSVLEDLSHIKRNGQDTAAVPIDDGSQATGAKVTSAGSDHTAILRGFFALRHSLQLEKPGRDNMLSAVKAITSGLCKDFQLAHGNVGDDMAGPGSCSVDELLGTTEQVYPSILQALQHTAPEKGEGGHVLFPGVLDVVKLFESILVCLHKSAVAEYVGCGSEPKSKDPAARPKTEADKLTAPIGILCGSTDGRALGCTLIKLMTTLDLSHNAHCELLEGFLCALLDHVGSSLSQVVFSDSKSRDAGILPPKGLLDDAGTDSQRAVDVVKVEGPYLVCILRQALDFLHANAEKMSEQGMLLFSLREATKDETLRHLIEATLQNTLLRGVFGDDDGTFYDALRRRKGILNHDLDKMLADLALEEDSVDWFIGQLWEQLGWDILSRKRLL